MKLKKILLIITLTIIIILTVLASIFLQPLLTGRTINPLDEYTHTMAICNNSNFCQDNLITCKGNKTISITPITGATIQHSEDWEDPREDKELCE